MCKEQTVKERNKLQTVTTDAMLRYTIIHKNAVIRKTIKDSVEKPAHEGSQQTAAQEEKT